MVKLQGLGEPLLHPQIQELIDLAKVAGHKIMIITNGSFPYVKNVDEYVFSLETLDFTKFEAIGKRNLSNVIKNIRDAASKQNVLINCVQCSQTTPQDVLEVQSFAREIGAKILITPQEVWVDPSHPEYSQQLADAKQAWQIHGVKMDYQKYVVCNWGVSEFYYDYTGTPHPCCIRMTDEYRNLKPSSEICKNCPL
jgi:MoaA/NifB/PqqE/SkfB family radical SAM enzyme